MDDLIITREESAQHLVTHLSARHHVTILGVDDHFDVLSAFHIQLERGGPQRAVDYLKSIGFRFEEG